LEICRWGILWAWLWIIRERRWNVCDGLAMRGRIWPVVILGKLGVIILSSDGMHITLLFLAKIGSLLHRVLSQLL